MNTRLPALLAAVAAVHFAAGADTPAPCCPPETTTAPCCEAKETVAAKAPCCEELKPAAPYSARSIYQVDAIWTDDAGRSVPLGTWRGRPVVIAMMFASCEYACPVLVNDIQRLRATLTPEERKKLQVVLVSFDTARDTPAALRAFRERMSLDEHWTLLTGKEAAVKELAMVLGVKYKQDARGQFAHSNLFTVLNPEGEIAHQHAGLMGDVSQAARLVGTVGK